MQFTDDVYDDDDDETFRLSRLVKVKFKTWASSIDFTYLIDFVFPLRPTGSSSHTQVFFPITFLIYGSLLVFG